MKVSTLILSFNSVDTIERTILGAMSQDISCDYEVIIADDGSTDGAQSIIRHYSKQYPLVIKPILSEVNRGPQQNILSALKVITGDLVALCDGDDYWICHQKLKFQLSYFLDDPLCDLVWTDTHIYEKSTNRWYANVFESGLIKNSIYLEHHLLNKSFYAPSTWMFNRKVVDLLIESNSKGYIDGTFYVMLHLLRSGKVKYLNIASSVYTRHINSQTNNHDYEKRYQFAKGIFRIQLEFLAESDQLSPLRDVLLKHEFTRLLLLAISYNDVAFMEHIAKLYPARRISFMLLMTKCLIVRFLAFYLIKMRRWMLRFFCGRIF